MTNTNSLPTKNATPSSISPTEKALLEGDLSKLNESERASYYKATCESLGLNALTKPFQYLWMEKYNSETRLKEKVLILYATKDCTDQLRNLQKISIQLVGKERIGNVYVVTARARTPDGREDESSGAVTIGEKLYGEMLANLYMKAETKAKRRVTLSICGLGFLDETEVETIPKASVVKDLKELKPGEGANVSSKTDALALPSLASLEKEKVTTTVEGYTIPFLPESSHYYGKTFEEIPRYTLIGIYDWVVKTNKSEPHHEQFKLRVESFLGLEKEPKEELDEMNDEEAGEEESKDTEIGNADQYFKH